MQIIIRILPPLPCIHSQAIGQTKSRSTVGLLFFLIGSLQPVVYLGVRWSLFFVMYIYDLGETAEDIINTFADDTKALVPGIARKIVFFCSWI